MLASQQLRNFKKAAHTGVEPVSPERQSERLASNPNEPVLSREQVILEGFEPSTICLEGRRSIQLSYKIIYFLFCHEGAKALSFFLCLLNLCDFVPSWQNYRHKKSTRLKVLYKIQRDITILLPILMHLHCQTSKIESCV